MSPTVSESWESGSSLAVWSVSGKLMRCSQAATWGCHPGKLAGAGGPVSELARSHGCDKAPSDPRSVGLSIDSLFIRIHGCFSEREE